MVRVMISLDVPHDMQSASKWSYHIHDPEIVAGSPPIGWWIPTALQEMCMARIIHHRPGEECGRVRLVIQIYFALPDLESRNEIEFDLFKRPDTIV